MSSTANNPDKGLFSYLNQINPIARFGSVTETTIDKDHIPVRHTNQPSSHQQSIKILSWNIAKNNHDKGWTREFLAIVEQYQPDKIFLQEVRLCAERQSIPELAEMGWSFAPNFIDTLSNAYSGVLIATRADRLHSQSIITDHTEPITNTPKVSLFAEYSLKNDAIEDAKNLLAVNTHLINFVDLSKFSAQLQALENVLAQHTGAIIFSGDFNTWNHARWEMLSQMTTRIGLTPVAFTAEDTQKIKSFLRSPPLDYIFYRGFRQKPLSATVIDTITSSDHNPLLVELCHPPSSTTPPEPHTLHKP